MKDFNGDIDILIKWIANRTDKHEEEKVNQWLEKDSALKEDFITLRSGAQAYLESDAHKRAVKSWAKFKENLEEYPDTQQTIPLRKQHRITVIIQRSLKIAAILLVSSLAGYLGFKYFINDKFTAGLNRQFMVITTERAHQKKISLNRLFKRRSLF